MADQTKVGQFVANALSPAQKAMNQMPMLTTFAKVPMNIQPNYPISPDLEMRTDGSTTPPLLDRIGAGLSLFGQKAKLFGKAVEDSFRK